jgi:large subunit ribosomal protein L15
VLNLNDLNRFEDGTEVTPEMLKENGIVKNAKSGIKVLGNGTLEKKLTIKAHKFSGSAAKAIEEQGGSYEVI